MGKETKIPVSKGCGRFRFSYFVIQAVINGEVASSSLIRDIKQGWVADKQHYKCKIVSDH